MYGDCECWKKCAMDRLANVSTTTTPLKLWLLPFNLLEEVRLSMLA